MNLLPVFPDHSDDRRDPDASGRALKMLNACDSCMNRELACQTLPPPAIIPGDRQRHSLQSCDTLPIAMHTTQEIR